MTKPIFNEEYEGGIQAMVDWVAGGNFDGYLFKKTILFKENTNEVIIKTIILDQSRYDEKKSDTEIRGEYEFTDKDTITVRYYGFYMRGKILKNNYIAFSVQNLLLKTDSTEVYQHK